MGMHAVHVSNALMHQVLATQGVEKPIVSKMLVEGSNRRAYAVDRHAGLVRASPMTGWMMPSA